MRKILFVIFLILFGTVSIYFLLQVKKNTPLLQNISNTPSVMAFMGEIQKIEDNLFVIKQLPTPVNPETPIYNIRITKDTVFIPSPTGEKEQKFTIKDLKVGQKISINVKKNDSILGEQYEAVNIALSPTLNLLTGKILDISENSITIETIQPPAVLQNSSYNITINDKTQITSEKLTLSELKKNMTVNIFTAEDINSGQNLTALRIEPITESNLPPAANPAAESSSVSTPQPTPNQ